MTARKRVLEHYQRPDVREAILKAGELEGYHRALVAGNDGWYDYVTEGGIDYKKIRPLTADVYDRAIPKMLKRHRSLYWTLNFFDGSVYEVHVPRDSAQSPGGYEETQFYGVGIDIDLKDAEKVEGLKRDRDVEIAEDRAMLEKAGRFVVNWLKEHGVPERIIRPYFSGNGLYVTIAPEVGYLAGEAQKAARICEAFNVIIKQIERDLYRECSGADNFVQFDALNNRKRQWKTILSVHKRKPFACIPLDPSNIEINLERARLPLSEEVVEGAKRWSDPIPKGERDKHTEALGKLFNALLIERSEHADLISETESALDSEDRDALKNDKISAALVARMKEIRDTGMKHGDFPRAKIEVDLERELGALPPCIRNILTEPRFVAHARGKAFLASVLSGLGISKENAKEIYRKSYEKAGGPPTNIFETWYGKLSPPCCDKIRTPGSGYPKIEMGDLEICQPDITCGEIRHPLQYIVRKKSEIAFDGESLHIPVLRGREAERLGEILIRKVGGNWEHAVKKGDRVYKTVASTPLGLESSRKAENRMRKWVGECVAPKTKEDAFQAETWNRLITNFRFAGALDQAREMPSAEAVELAGMVKEAIIKRQLDGEENFPITLKVSYDGQEKTLNLNSRSLLQAPSLQVAFLKAFHHVPPILEDLSKRTILEATQILRADGKVKEIEEEESTEHYITQAILVELQRSRPTKEIEEAASMGRTALWEGGKLWLPNTRIQNVMKAERIGASLRKVRGWMEPYLAGNATKKRVKNETIRFWAFDPAKCGIDPVEIENQLKEGGSDA